MGVVRGYIDFLILLTPTPLVCNSIPTSVFILKYFFIIYIYMYECFPQHTCGMMTKSMKQALMKILYILNRLYGLEHLIMRFNVCGKSVFYVLVL